MYGVILMNNKRIGTQTVVLPSSPSVIGFAAVGGKFESQGPLAGSFDLLEQDSMFGQKTWEQGESVMQKKALETALFKAGIQKSQLDYVFAGDLLNQCIGSSFSLRDSNLPFYGLYGACSTMGESLSMAGGQD